VSAITAKAEKALRQTGMKQMVLAGGVAANSHLRASLTEMCQNCGVTLYAPPISLCGDNAAMIAAAGYYQLLDGDTAGTDLNASACD
jgi:N6-L-threonylcarbamoyladenine synthase